MISRLRELLYKDHLLNIIFTRFGFNKTFNFNLQIDELKTSPLSLFYFNQRALFLIGGGIYITVFALIVTVNS